MATGWCAMPMSRLGYVHPQRRRLSPRPLRGANRPVDLMEIAAAIPTTPPAHQPQHPLMLNEARCHPSSRSNLSPLNPLAHPPRREGEGQQADGSGPIRRGKPLNTGQPWDPGGHRRAPASRTTRPAQGAGRRFRPARRESASARDRFAASRLCRVTISQEGLQHLSRDAELATSSLSWARSRAASFRRSLRLLEVNIAVYQWDQDGGAALRFYPCPCSLPAKLGGPPRIPLVNT